MKRKEMLINAIRNLTFEYELEKKAIKKWLESVKENEYDEIKEEMETLDFPMTIWTEDNKKLLNSVPTTEFVKWAHSYGDELDLEDIDDIAIKLVSSVVLTAYNSIHFEEIEEEEEEEEEKFFRGHGFTSEIVF